MYVTYNLCFCEAPAKELLGSKTGCQILQICKILNVLHISLHYGYFFKSMYSRHQMMATLSKYIPRKQPTHDAPRNNTLFLDLKYINLVKLQNTTCGKANFNIFIGLQREVFQTTKNSPQKGQFHVNIFPLFIEIF